MLRQVLLTVGRPRAEFATACLEHYARRLKPYGGCALEWVRAQRGGKGVSAEQVRRAEGGRLLERVAPRDVLWVMDQRGQGWSSQQWAHSLRAVREGGVPRLVLVVGGAEGLDQAVRERAQAVVSLGPLTLAHELAACVVLEQLYRAHTILAGTPYHRG